jgi:hypothetical protein
VGPLAGKLTLRFKGVMMKLATREMTDGDEYGDTSLARLPLPCTGDGDSERSLFKRTPLKEETCEASNANAFGERESFAGDVYILVASEGHEGPDGAARGRSDKG